MEENKKKWLSHSGLDILYRCPRCFWLKYNKNIYQPEGIVSRLPDRFDRIVKRYFDKFRIKGDLPLLVKGKIEGKLQNPFQEKYFYPMNRDYGFWGKLDECLVEEDGSLAPVDFKTASSDPSVKEIYPAYQNQMDEYAMLLKGNGKKISSFGYLIFFYPQESEELHSGFPMALTVKKIETNPRSAYDRILDGIKILEDKMPESSLECPFCAWSRLIEKTIKE